MNEPKKLKILWIDFEVYSFIKVIESIKEKGFDVIGCQSHVDGIHKLLSDKDIDIVFLEFVQPISTVQIGMEMIPKVKQANPYINLVLITQSTNEEIIKISPALGVLTTMQKPINVNQIHNVLDKIASFEKNNEFRFEIKIPDSLRTIYQQYLLFFKDFVKTSKGKKIDFLILQTKSGLEVVTETTNKFSIKNLNEYLNEYIGFIKSNSDELTVEVHPDINPQDFKFLMLDLKNQIRHLKQNLEVSEFKTKILLDENAFLKQVTLNLSEKIQPIAFNEPLMSPFDKVKEQIKRGRTKKAVEELSELLEKEFPDYHNELIIYSSRLYKVMLEARTGIVEREKEMLEVTKINSSILDLIKSIEIEEKLFGTKHIR